MRRIAIAAALLGAAVSGACRDNKPYRLGVVLGGEGMGGARAAVDVVNAAGGINGHRLELRSGGGASTGSAEIALAAAESLADDASVLAVVGHANSSASLAASQVYNARGMIQLAATTTAPIYSHAGPYSFRMVSSDEDQARFLADTIAAMHPHGLTIVYVNDDYGRALRLLVRTALAAHHQGIAYEAPYVESDTAGNAELIGAVRRHNTDMLLWLGRAMFYSTVSRGLHESLPGLKVIASDGFGGSTVEDDVSHLFEGVRYVRFIDVNRSDSAMTAFRRVYRAVGTSHMSDEAVLAFDAVRVLAEAIRTGGPNREAIRTYLSQLGKSRAAYQGVTGPIEFTDRRARVSAYHLREVAPWGGAR